MPKTKTSKTSGIFPFLTFTILLATYFILSFLVYEDSLLAVDKPSSVSAIGLHSGKYSFAAAEWFQFRAHDPAELKQLFKTALIRSPADFNSFLAYFDYLRHQECCKAQADNLIRATMERNPSNVRLYLLAVKHFLDRDQKNEALAYIHKAVQMQPTTLRSLFVIAEDKINQEEIIRITPRTKETLPLLAQVLATSGPDAKEEWLRTIEELHSNEVEPQLKLKTAEQAMNLGEMEIAKKYAEAALAFHETEAAAKKMLDKIERIQDRRQNPKRGRRNK